MVSICQKEKISPLRLHSIFPLPLHEAVVGGKVMTQPQAAILATEVMYLRPGVLKREAKEHE
jgi:hypothetical protein